MHTFLKAIIVITLGGLGLSAMATDTFIVKYKLNESQRAFLLAHRGADAKEAKAKIREELMQKLSKEQLAALSAPAQALVMDSHSLANGAHVIILNKDLDEKQTEQFIHAVAQYSDIEFIEPDNIQQPL